MNDNLMNNSRTKQSIIKYLQRQDKKTLAPKRKNKKPEKQVEKDVLNWCRSKGWSVSVVESKAVFSKSAGRFLSGQAKAGFADVVGVHPSGLFVAIELKAPGRLNTLREAQYKYLSDIISKNGFAVVVDSSELLNKYNDEFSKLDGEKRKEYLMSILPVPKEIKEDTDKIFID